MLAATAAAALPLKEIDMSTPTSDEQVWAEMDQIDDQDLFFQGDSHDEVSPESTDFEPIEVRCAEEDPAKQVTD
ncbi:hypothetical protein [Chondromyces crocatus]|uniref:Uncharacterized protein n=1 Tax=Chondromyces crocatus TaxID=52 RepID=A0A0K1EDW9_CHOCO|nr:hypothetical protein [Chondromyces crocatus]AKT38778.1 uncharacterized protein CMC5_029240 [Chondromyces crocatus]